MTGDGVQRVIRCDCGFEATAMTDDDLIAAARSHARSAHEADVPSDLLLDLARPRDAPSGDPPRS